MRKQQVAVAVLAVSFVHAGRADAARPTTGYIKDSAAMSAAPKAGARNIGPGTVIYFNRHGGTYTYGEFDSRKNSNLIGAGTLPPFECGDDKWREVMTCLKDSFLPFGVRITDIDPGSAEHAETVVAGGPADVGQPPNVGGIAPLGCNQYLDNPITFAFSQPWGCDVNQICWAAAQETAHAFGL